VINRLDLFVHIFRRHYRNRHILQTMSKLIETNSMAKRFSVRRWTLNENLFCPVEKVRWWFITTVRLYTCNMQNILGCNYLFTSANRLKRLPTWPVHAILVYMYIARLCVESEKKTIIPKREIGVIIKRVWYNTRFFNATRLCVIRVSLLAFRTHGNIKLRLYAYFPFRAYRCM